VERNWNIHFYDSGKISKTTEKMLSVWFDIGATGANFNSFVAADKHHFAIPMAAFHIPSRF
jgi:transposase